MAMIGCAVISAHGGTRTPDLLIRSQSLSEQNIVQFIGGTGVLIRANGVQIDIRGGAYLAMP